MNGEYEDLEPESSMTEAEYQAIKSARELYHNRCLFPNSDKLEVPGDLVGAESEDKDPADLANQAAEHGLWGLTTKFLEQTELLEIDKFRILATACRNCVERYTEQNERITSSAESQKLIKNTDEILRASRWVTILELAVKLLEMRGNEK